MKPNPDETGRRVSCVQMLVGLALVLMLLAPCVQAQAQTTEQKAADQKPAESKPFPGSYQTLYLTNVSELHQLNDVVTDMRNMLPRARLYSVQSQNAVSFFGTAEDLALAQKMIADLDKPQIVYRLTYTITEMDGGKEIGKQHFALTATSGGRTTLKLGSRVPIITGSYDTGATKSNSQVQYQDVGLTIDAFLDGQSLRTKIEQTSPTGERTAGAVQDPVIRQTVLDATANFAAGKPLALGSIDIPGSTRHEDVEVVAEAVL